MERTLSIIKPDGVGRGLIGEVIKRLEANDLNIIAMKMIYMTKAQAEGFYAVHKERPFFESLTTFMSSGPAVVMVLEVIYEQDFLNCSYGFRPGRSAHQALNSFRDQTMNCQTRGEWVLEVDIRKFFDNLAHRTPTAVSSTQGA